MLEKLKKLFSDGSLTWEQFSTNIKDMKLVDLKEGKYVDKDKYDNLLNEKTTLDEEVKKRDAQLEDLKKANPEELKAKIESLKTENEQSRAKYEKEVRDLKINSALDLTLNKVGARNAKAVKALLDLNYDEVEFDEQGNLKGLTDKLEGLKGSDAYLFNTEDEGASKGGFNGVDPEPSNPNPVPTEPTTYADFLAIELAKEGKTLDDL